MEWHESVDRLRRAAPSGKRLNERAADEIVADQEFGHEADPEAREDRRAHCLRAVRPEIARDVDCSARASRTIEYPTARSVPPHIEDAGVRGEVLRLGKRLGETQIIWTCDEQPAAFANFRGHKSAVR